jgi:O-methyltransferase domain
MSNPTAQSASRSNVFAELIQLSRGYMPATCLHAVARLKIADLLAGGPRPVAELALASKTNEDALYRVLRALSSLGVFRETAARTFASTPLSDAIRSDSDDSARDAVLFMVDGLHLRIYGELAHTIETGETAFRKVTGMQPFEFFHQNAEENVSFNNAMSSISRVMIHPIIEAYDFGDSGALADIGGGHGALLAAILQKHPRLRGIVFDLPHVVAGARELIASQGLESRCELSGGDFFQSVPPADSYVMKSVIHDWDDARAIAILKNCASALSRPNGKVILLEMLVGPANEPELAKWIDVEMLAVAGGRERTEAEFADLLAKAGLRLARIVRTGSPFAVIESVKA